MGNPQETTASPADSEELVRTAHLRRRICDAWETIKELQAERQGLEEILQNLRAQQESLTDRLAVLEVESRDTSERLAHNQKRLQAIEAEIELLNQQNDGLSEERSFIGRQARKLSHAAAVLNEEVDKRRRQVTKIQSSFETITTSVLRMDYKLQHHERQSRDRHESKTKHDES